MTIKTPRVVRVILRFTCGPACWDSPCATPNDEPSPWPDSPECWQAWQLFL